MHFRRTGEGGGVNDDSLSLFGTLSSIRPRLFEERFTINRRASYPAEPHTRACPASKTNILLLGHRHATENLPVPPPGFICARFRGIVVTYKKSCALTFKYFLHQVHIKLLELSPHVARNLHQRQTSSLITGIKQV